MGVNTRAGVWEEGLCHKADGSDRALNVQHNGCRKLTTLAHGLLADRTSICMTLDEGMMVQLASQQKANKSVLQLT